MVVKAKKVYQKPLKLVKLLCENCGLTVEVPLDSVCAHCGQKMVIDKPWRHKYNDNNWTEDKDNEKAD